MNINKYEKQIDEEITSIISFLTFHNLENQTKIVSVDIQYLDSTGKLKKLPITTCSELYDELNKDNDEKKHSDGFQEEIKKFVEDIPTPGIKHHISLKEHLREMSDEKKNLIEELKGYDHPDNKTLLKKIKSALGRD